MKNMIKYLFIALILLILPIVNAQEYTSKSCMNDTTLQTDVVFFITDSNGSTENYTISQNTSCVYGCDYNNLECKPNPITTDILIIVGIFGFVILISLAILVLKKI